MPRKNQEEDATSTSSSAPVEAETQYSLVNVTDWDIQKLKCGVMKTNKSQMGKSANLTYDGHKFYLKIPKMFVPFAASLPNLSKIEKKGPEVKEKEPKEGEAGTDKWSVQFSFGDSKECQTFQAKAQEFDQFMIDQGTIPDNSLNWLGGTKAKPMSRDVVESKYHPMVKLSIKEGVVLTQYPPTIRALLPTDFNNNKIFACEFYDAHNTKLSVSTDINSDDCVSKIITQGCCCSALLTGSIWSGALGFGVTWRVAQIKVYPSKTSIPKGKCLINDPDDEEGEEPEKEGEDEEIEEEETTDVQVEKTPVKTEPVKPEPVKVVPAPQVTQAPQITPATQAAGAPVSVPKKVKK